MLAVGVDSSAWYFKTLLQDSPSSLLQAESQATFAPDIWILLVCLISRRASNVTVIEITISSILYSIFEDISAAAMQHNHTCRASATTKR